MTKPSRFSYDAPGWVPAFWNMLHTDGRVRNRAWITDNERRERFQLSEDEEIMMDVLSENIHDVVDLKKVPLWQLNRFWTSEKILCARDQVLTAFSDRRHGDATKWEQLKAMEPAQWINWLSGLQASERDSN